MGLKGTSELNCPTAHFAGVSQRGSLLFSRLLTGRQSQRQNLGVPCPNSWKLNVVPYTGEGILQIGLRTLRWGDYFGLSGWAQYNYMDS